MFACVRHAPSLRAPLGAAALAAGLWLAGAGLGTGVWAQATERASPEVTAAALAVLPEGVRPEDICRTGGGGFPHLGQLWPAATLARLDLRDRRGGGLRGLFAKPAPARSPDPEAADFMVMEIAGPSGPFDPDEVWLRLRPSDRLRGGAAADVWLHYASDDTVRPEIRAVLAAPPAAGG